MSSKEYKEYQKAKRDHDNFGQVTSYNKKGYDTAQNTLAEKHRAYKDWLKANVKK
jgi:hypothetical protein